MAALTTQTIAVTGTTPNYVAAGASGDTIEASDGVFLHVKNAGAGSVSVTVAVPGTEYGQARPDVVVPVAAGAEGFIFIPAALADSSDERVHVTYSATASVTVAVLSV